MSYAVPRSAKSTILFVINDAAGGLAGKRVTCAFALPSTPNTAVLRKASAVPGSTAAVTIDIQTPTQITGKVNLLTADFAVLTADQYVLTFWVDDNAGNEFAATPRGIDKLVILPTVPRS